MSKLMTVYGPGEETESMECEGRTPPIVDCHPVGLDDEIEHDAEEEHEPQKALRNPGQATTAQIDEHNISHIPFRPWCKHCVRGKAKDKQSRRLTAGQAQSSAPRIRLDYCMLTDKSIVAEGDEEEIADGDAQRTTGEKVEGKEEIDGDGCATVLVMQESECRSVWAYQVQHKGGSEEWVVDQIIEDLDTIGLRNDKVVVKSDQESSAAEISRAIARCRNTDYGAAVEE